MPLAAMAASLFFNILSSMELNFAGSIWAPLAESPEDSAAEEAPERLSELLVEHLQEWRGR